MKNYLTLKLNKQTLLNKLTVFILFLLFTSGLSAQEIAVSQVYPTDFRPPLDLAPALAGSFGEIRSNHFHSGLDYRTNQREGYPVYAVADGSVSRLRVQIGGFGNAVYITHLNGYTSVYAHLQRFNERITQLIKDYQYKNQSFEADFMLLPFDIQLKKGELIAWSGNTGSSGGPHLHFELRDSKTEETINPQLFGIDIPDQVKPQITALYMYRLNGKPFSPNTVRQYFQLTGTNGNYTLNKAPVINLNGETGFGITAFDQQLAGGNKNGVYSAELLLDGQAIFTSVLERFAFINSRAINSHIDYPFLIRSGGTIQKSFAEPGNPLGIYKNVVNRGIIDLKDSEIHNLKYIVKDVKGNMSTLQFQIKNNPESVIAAAEDKGVKMFAYNQVNEFEADGLKVSIPKGVLYNDLNFAYSVSSRSSGYSNLHTVHNRLTPLHENFNLWIKPVRDIPAHLRSKVLLVNANGGHAGGTYDDKDGYVKGNPRSFGSYYIGIDTIPPAIRPVNIQDEKSMAGLNKILLKMSDNLSGIRSFSGTIDGQWVLMEYDLKTSSVWHTFDYRTASGKHIFEFTVTDMKQNVKTYTASFYK